MKEGGSVRLPVCMQCYVLHEGIMADPCSPPPFAGGMRGELKPRDGCCCCCWCRCCVLYAAHLLGAHGVFIAYIALMGYTALHSPQTDDGRTLRPTAMLATFCHVSGCLSRREHYYSSGNQTTPSLVAKTRRRPQSASLPVCPAWSHIGLTGRHEMG